MNVAFIVPTGLGAEIGGHAGDASPSANLIASMCDHFITHPNVYNASEINEMPANALYVEGSILDRFLSKRIGLKLVKSNKILVVVNAPVVSETINAVSAARATICIDAKIVELSTPLTMTATKVDGAASGDVSGWRELIEQISQYDYDALAIATEIDCNEKVALDYMRNGGVNPWGGVEAIASKLIAGEINKPVAHAPTESEALMYFNEVVDPREAAEALSMAYLHCVLKGLHKAPRVGNDIWVDDVDCLITPAGCCGPPHFGCMDAGIPIIVVKENKTIGTTNINYDKAIYVENYLEAAGVVAAIKAGISLESVTRPLMPTEIIKI